MTRFPASDPRGRAKTWPYLLFGTLLGALIGWGFGVRSGAVSDEVGAVIGALVGALLSAVLVWVMRHDALSESADLEPGLRDKHYVGAKAPDADARASRSDA